MVIVLNAIRCEQSSKQIISRAPKTAVVVCIVAMCNLIQGSLFYRDMHGCVVKILALKEVNQSFWLLDYWNKYIIIWNRL